MRTAPSEGGAAEKNAPDPEERLLSALEAIDEAFFRMGAVRDTAGRIVDFEYQYCNRAALAVLGRPRGEVLGRRLLELFPSHRTNGLFDAFAQVTETGDPLRYEFTFDEGGVAGVFEIVASRAEDGYVLAGHDISERRRRERDVATGKAVDNPGQDAAAARTQPGGPEDLVRLHMRLSHQLDSGEITAEDFKRIWAAALAKRDNEWHAVLRTWPRRDLGEDR
jgi:PAS domain S-box-containing protein